MKSLLAQVAILMRKYPATERVSLVFDRQRELSANAVELFNRGLEEMDWEGSKRFSAIEFGAKDDPDKVPLQAADALAYDSCREFERRYYYPERKIRPSYTVLTNHLPFEEYIWDQQQAQQFIQIGHTLRTLKQPLSS